MLAGEGWYSQSFFSCSGIPDSTAPASRGSFLTDRASLQLNRKRFLRSSEADVPAAYPEPGSLANPGDLNGNVGFVVVRTSVEPELVENQLRAAIRSLDPQLPPAQMQTIEQTVGGSEAPRRFNTVLISCFAAVALLLAVLGIYSVIAFTVAMRVHEMAIRMVLGSQRSGIVKLVLSSGLKLAAAGCMIGLVGAFFASRLLQSLVFDVSTLDPLVLSLAALTVLVLAAAASLLPARRAAAINPTDALRAE